MTVKAVLDVERSQLGYKEGANNKTKYGAAYGLDHASWCNEFQWWSFQRADENIIGKFAYVPYQMDWFRDRDAWQAKTFWGAHRGDLVFWDWEHNGVPNHIEIIEGFTSSGNIVTIGGNTGSASNGVYRQTRSLTFLLGTGRPAYSDAATLWPGHVYKQGVPKLGNVRRIQEKLGGLAADGEFGPKTKAKVVAFQKAHKLAGDGEVGMATWHELF